MKKVIMGLVLAMGAMLSFTSCNSDSPEAAVKSFCEAQAKKDFKAALDVCCDTAGKALAAEAVKDMEEFMGDKANADKLLASCEVVESVVTEDGNTADVKAKVKDAAGNESEQTFKCFKVDGKWKVAIVPTALPQKVVAKYYDCLVKQDFKAALEYCCDAQGTPLTAEKKQQVASTMDSKVKDESTKSSFAKSYKIVESKMEEDGNKATVDVEKVTFGDETKNEAVKCIKTDGVWYVVSAK